MTAPLKACPFCGSTSIYLGCRSGTARAGGQARKNDKRRCVYLECESCCASMFEVFRAGARRYQDECSTAQERLAERWNTRKTQEEFGTEVTQRDEQNRAIARESRERAKQRRGLRNWFERNFPPPWIEFPW